MATLVEVWPDPLVAKFEKLRADNAELRDQVARLDRELDHVVAVVHDRAPELLELIMEVPS